MEEGVHFDSQRALLLGPRHKDLGMKEALNDVEKLFWEDRVVSNAFRIWPIRNSPKQTKVWQYGKNFIYL